MNGVDGVINDYLRSQIDNYCYMVQRGKPAALIAIQERYLKEAMDIVKQQYGLKIYKEKLTNDDWLSLWIYKNDYIPEIIKKVPRKPESIFDHWVLGKLFGYSEEAIQDFLFNPL